MAKKFLDSNGVLYLWQKIVGAFVKKESGKGLSTNDFTDEQKTKLAGLENYELPKASADNLGGVKVGAGLSVNENGVLSATGGGTADAVDWANVQDKPETFPPATHSHKMEDITDAPAVAKTGSYKDLTITDVKFYEEAAHTTEITGEAGKIYIDLDTNLSFRWGGSKYVLITSSDMTALTNAEIDNLIKDTV